jgi:hypothetical protein
MENKQTDLELIRKIRKTLEKCSDEIAWTFSRIDNLFAKIDEAAKRVAHWRKR